MYLWSTPTAFQTTLETVKRASRQVSRFWILVSELSNRSLVFGESDVGSDIRISNRSRLKIYIFKWVASAITNWPNRATSMNAQTSLLLLQALLEERRRYCFVLDRICFTVHSDASHYNRVCNQQGQLLGQETLYG